MDKSEIRSLLFQLDRARRRLMQPYFTALGLPLGQGQPRILTRLLEDYVRRDFLRGEVGR